MKTALVVSLMLMLGFGCRPKPDPKMFYMPAEWEPQEEVWLGWDEDSPLEDSVHVITASIVKELQESVRVIVWITKDSLVNPIREFLINHHVPLTNTQVSVVNGDYVFWSRDSGPAFTINKLGERRAVDFNHTGYFRYIKRLSDVGADSAAIADYQQEIILMMRNDSLMASLRKEPLVKSWMFVEGGAYEVNGKGSLMVSEPFLFRNLSKEMRDTLTKKHFEEEFKRTLGVTNVIWLSTGLAEDGGWGAFFENYTPGGTNGHADEFVRFANPSTILLAWVDEQEKNDNPVKKATYERMKKNYEILRNATDQDGKPFTIVKVPMPETITKDWILTANYLDKWNRRDYYHQQGFKEGDTLKLVAAASYLNFLISNNKILLSTYTKHGTSTQKEEQVKKIFTDNFPNHELIFLDAKIVNTMGGGIHCITRQVPVRLSAN